jgi:DNA-binding response OmpR family regulator
LVGRSDCFDGFILKPISPTHLVNRVDAYLHLRRDSHDAFGPPTLFVDEYDCGRREAASGKREAGGDEVKVGN